MQYCMSSLLQHNLFHFITQIVLQIVSANGGKYIQTSWLMDTTSTSICKGAFRPLIPKLFRNPLTLYEPMPTYTFVPLLPSPSPPHTPKLLVASILRAASPSLNGKVLCTMASAISEASSSLNLVPCWPTTTAATLEASAPMDAKSGTLFKRLKSTPAAYASPAPHVSTGVQGEGGINTTSPFRAR